MRLMTWNIHGALGRNPRFDLARVVEYVQKHNPDIVALQEIDSRRARAAGMGDPFDVLREALGTYGTHAHAISTADGDYGQAIISRWPLVSSSVHDLSYPEREPRRAISAYFATPVGNLHVIATHLGLSFRERDQQAQILLKLLDHADVPTVVMGDFNDWFWAGSVRRVLGRVLPRCTHQRTFPAYLPLLKLDRVYVSEELALVGHQTDVSARGLSDHLPIIADVECQQGQGVVQARREENRATLGKGR
jgi:endonuclease/exonuclease/phosphatase family metal-dependent hydrolase